MASIAQRPILLLTHLPVVVELNTVKHLFQTETLREGAYFDDPKSASQIPAFIQHYGLDMSQCEQSDPAAFGTFNEFFARKIKPEVRPISDPEDDVSLSARFSGISGPYSQFDSQSSPLLQTAAWWCSLL